MGWNNEMTTKQSRSWTPYNPRQEASPKHNPHHFVLHSSLFPSNPIHRNSLPFPTSARARRWTIWWQGGSITCVSLDTGPRQVSRPIHVSGSEPRHCGADLVASRVCNRQTKQPGSPSCFSLLNEENNSGLFREPGEPRLRHIVARNTQYLRRCREQLVNSPEERNTDS